MRGREESNRRWRGSEEATTVQPALAAAAVDRPERERERSKRRGGAEGSTEKENGEGRR